MNGFKPKISTIKYFIENGYDVDSKNKFGTTLLSSYVKFNSDEKENIELIKYLIKQGADINSRDNFGNTPLHYAMRLHYPSSIQVVKLLLDAGADSMLMNDNEEIPLDLLKSTMSFLGSRDKYPEIGRELENMIKEFSVLKRATTKETLLKENRSLIEPLVDIVNEYLISIK